ncbi:MAG: hypothetical protein SFU25_07460 [Candidatus Caenarcaniphilales bacterium]|nr:hypothetical protein [Candidatus Caenarcaniphilales bacterium]
MGVSRSSPRCLAGSSFVKNPLIGPSGETIDVDYCIMLLNLRPGSRSSLLNNPISFNGLTTQQNKSLGDLPLAPEESSIRILPNQLASGFSVNGASGYKMK